MLFDRQILYLALLLGAERVYGRAIDVSGGKTSELECILLNNTLITSTSAPNYPVSPNPTASSPSPSLPRAAVQATRAFSFLKSDSSPRTPPTFGSPYRSNSDCEHLSPPIPSGSASSLASPSTTSNSALYSVLSLAHSGAPFLSGVGPSVAFASASLSSSLPHATDSSSAPAIESGATPSISPDHLRSNVNVDSTSSHPPSGPSNIHRLRSPVIHDRFRFSNSSSNSSTMSYASYYGSSAGSYAASGSVSAAAAISSSGNLLGEIYSLVPSSLTDDIQSIVDSVTSDLFNSQSASTTSSTPTSTSATTTPTTHRTRPSPTTPTTMATAVTRPSPEPTEEREILGAHPIPNASVAGIATGLIAGAVLIGIGVVYLFRRRQQGKPVPFFGRQGSQRSEGGPYPKVAWLYDPVITPAGSPGQSRRGSEAEENLLPDPRPGSVEMAGGQPHENLRPTSAQNPFLAPPHSRSPSPGPSGSSSNRSSRDDMEMRPLRQGIDEEGGA